MRWHVAVLARSKQQVYEQSDTILLENVDSFVTVNFVIGAEQAILTRNATFISAQSKSWPPKWVSPPTFCTYEFDIAQRDQRAAPPPEY